MKKFESIFIAVVITICIMTGLGYLLHTEIIGDYVEDSKSVSEDYEDEISMLEEELEELKSEHAELEEGVYNMKNGKPYSITICHEGKVYAWYCKDNKGIFKNEVSIKDL